MRIIHVRDIEINRRSAFDAALAHAMREQRRSSGNGSNAAAAPLCDRMKSERSRRNMTPHNAQHTGIHGARRGRSFSNNPHAIWAGNGEEIQKLRPVCAEERRKFLNPPPPLWAGKRREFQQGRALYPRKRRRASSLFLAEKMQCKRDTRSSQSVRRFRD